MTDSPKDTPEVVDQGGDLSVEEYLALARADREAEMEIPDFDDGHGWDEGRD